MAEDQSDIKEQLVGELEIVKRNGVGRDLYRDKTEEDIPNLVAIAREIAPDPSLPIRQLVTKAIWEAVEKLYPRERVEYAAALLGIDLDKNPDDSDISFPPTLLDGERRPNAMKLHPVANSSYERNPNQYERPRLEEIADRLVTSWETSRDKGILESTEPQSHDAGGVQTQQPDTVTETGTGPPVMFVGAVGALLIVAGVAWLIAVMSGVIG